MLCSCPWLDILHRAIARSKNPGGGAGSLEHIRTWGLVLTMVSGLCGENQEHSLFIWLRMRNNSEMKAKLATDICLNDVHLYLSSFWSNFFTLESKHYLFYARKILIVEHNFISFKKIKKCSTLLQGRVALAIQRKNNILCTWSSTQLWNHKSEFCIKSIYAWRLGKTIKFLP